MKDKRGRIIGVLNCAIVIAAVGTLGSVAIADTYLTPGWQWGRTHCSPWNTPIRSEAACKTCCETMVTDPNINDQIEIPNCKAFCENVHWDSGWDEEEEEEDEDGDE